MKSAESFKADYVAATKEYQKECIIFTDKISLNFSALKARSSRNPKIATVLLSMTLEGIILKPFVVLSEGINVKDFTKDEYISWVHRDQGEANDTSIEMWMEQCLIKNNAPHLLVSQPYEIFRSQFLATNFQKHLITTLFLPEGVSCMLNPFKEITPLFIESVTKHGKESEHMMSCKRLKGADVLNWIIDSIFSIAADHSAVLHTAFDCLK